MARIVPVAVLVDSAAFEHEIEFPGPVAGKLGDVVADGLIVGEVELAAPAIELEAEREPVPVAPREDRAGIAQPDVAVLRMHELSGVPKLLARSRFDLGAVHQQPHPVRRRKRAHQRGDIAARRGEVSVPFLKVGGPRGPDRLLRGPLRRNNRCVHHGISHDALPIESALIAQRRIYVQASGHCAAIYSRNQTL